MLCRAQLEVSWQLKANSNRTIVGNRCHRAGVSELRDISSKAEFGFEKQEKMARSGAAHRLKLNVSAVEIACVGRAGGSGPAGTGRLWKHATAKIRFVVRRSHGEIRVTADPVMGEKRPWLCREMGYSGRFSGRFSRSTLGVRGKSRNGQGYRQKGKNSIHQHSPRVRRASSSDWPSGEGRSGFH